MTAIEAQLLEFWTASAAIWRERTAPHIGAGADNCDLDVLGGGGESYLIETWAERKARKAKEREAIKAASMPKRRRVKQ